jgi:hypothetical protein
MTAEDRPQASASSVSVLGRRKENLRPFQRGKSGNPSGRPKCGRLVSTALAGLLDEVGASPGEVIENFRRRRGKWICGSDVAAIAIFETATDAGAKCQMQAAGLIFDRTEGKIESSTPATGGGNFTMNITIQALGGESLEGLPPSIQIIKTIPALPALPAAVDEEE